MTSADRKRLKQIRAHYARAMDEEKMLKFNEIDPREVMGWVPSECEAVFLLRLLSLLEVTC